MVIIAICLLMEKKYVNLKLMIKMLNVNLIYDKFGSNYTIGLFLEEDVDCFSVDDIIIDKSKILGIHKYLMTKNSVENFLE